MRRSGLAGFLCAFAVLPLLAACTAETEHSLIVNPLDIRPFEGFWINAKGDIGEVLSISATDESGQTASVKFISINRRTQDVAQSPLTARVTAIGGVWYFEATAASPGDGGKPQSRMFGRLSFGTTETPDDHNKLTVCLANADDMKAAIAEGALQGTTVKAQSPYASETVRITSGTNVLRAHLAKQPLKCSLFTTSIFVRPQRHFLTSR